MLIGGCQNFFRTGRSVQYPAMYDNPVTGPVIIWPRIGPGHNKLYVSLLQALGQPHTQFGTTETHSSSGQRIDLTSALDQLTR